MSENGPYGEHGQCPSGEDHGLGEMPGACDVCASFEEFMEHVGRVRDEMFEAIVARNFAR